MACSCEWGGIVHGGLTCGWCTGCCAHILSSPPLHAHSPCSHRSQRQQQSFLAVKTLGAADEEDDMSSWVERSRRAEEQRKREQQERQQAQQQRGARGGGGRGDDDDEEEEQGGGYGGKDLAGLKVWGVG